MTDERAFLQAILEKPDDDSRKLVYADWLEEQSDPRAEYLRLMVKVRQERVVTPEQRQRHQELSAELATLRNREMEAFMARMGNPGSAGENQGRQRRIAELERQLAKLTKQIRQQVPARLQERAAAFDLKWLAVVRDPEIEGCGKSAGEGWRPHFEFVCDKTWSDLKPTGDTSVRHCEICNRNVHFCDNLADAREHATESRCIAVDLGVLRRENDLEPRMMFLGRPSRESVRKSYEEDVDPVSQARLASKKQAKKLTKKR